LLGSPDKPFRAIKHSVGSGDEPDPTADKEARMADVALQALVGPRKYIQGRGVPGARR
jgi:hypothetical protein